jgi:hypothetical protein
MRADEKLTAFLELGSAIRDCSIGSKLSSQRGANFREVMGNGLRFRITWNDGHKHKTRKENHMKNRNIQVKPTRGLLIPLLLTCLAAVFISAPNPASARDQVPFNGTLSGCVETQEPVDQCTIHAHAALFGNATQLGAFTGTGEFYENFCEDPPNITYAGSFHLFAANGDEIYGTFEGYLSPTGTPGVYDNHETSDVTGGTGRFTSATGHWDSGGQVDFTTEPPCFSSPVQGWISSVGSNRR